MSDDEASRAKVAALRARKPALESEVRKLESQVALAEKQGVEKRLAELEAKLEAASAELERVTEELDASEAALVEHAATTEELERLVDSFGAVARDVPELSELLAAMKLCVGALASARRLERRDESLVEAKDISRALNEALLRLANTLSSRAQVLARVKGS